MASSPLLRKSHSDRCAKRDPRARRVRRMINRADMQIFRQTVPPLRRSRSDRCARRDPRARRGAPMNRRADMRVFRQTVPPLRRSQSDRCAQRDPRAHAGDKRPSRAAMRLPPFKGAAWGWTQGGHHSRAQARQGGGLGDEQRERAPEHPTPHNPVEGVGCVRASSASITGASAGPDNRQAASD